MSFFSPGWMVSINWAPGFGDSSCCHPNLSLLDLLCCVEKVWQVSAQYWGIYIYRWKTGSYIFHQPWEKWQDWGSFGANDSSFLHRSCEVDFLDALLLTHDHADAILGSGLSGKPWESDTGNLRMCYGKPPQQRVNHGNHGIKNHGKSLSCMPMANYGCRSTLRWWSEGVPQIYVESDLISTHGMTYNT